MKISTLVIVLSLAVSAYAGCGNLGATSCETCATDYNCVWCHSTSSCVEGDHDIGPVNVTCPEYSSPYGSCSETWYQTCSDVPSCDACTAFNFSPISCVWCQTTGTCVNGNSTSGPEVACADWSSIGCTFCSEVSDCDNCTNSYQWIGNQFFSCGWCTSSMSCMAGTESAPHSGTCAAWDYWGDDCNGGNGYCVNVEGSSSFCPSLPSKSCSDDNQPIDASDYNEETYAFISAIMGGLLCPLHPDWLGFGQSDYCNIGSCTSDADCVASDSTLSMAMCWDLCIGCQGNSTLCEEWVSIGVVAEEGETDCASSFDELFTGNGVALHFVPLLVLFMTFLMMN